MNKNNLIIAGVPRAGKSTMSNMLSRNFGYQHVSFDSIIAGLETVFPELGNTWWPSSNNETENMERLFCASKRLSLFIRAMLESGEYDEFEPGMIADVYQLLPEHYMTHLSDKNCEIIYLITSDITTEERIDIHKAYDTKKDYSFYFSDEEMYNHCEFVVKRSQFIREQCKKYGLPYYETAKNRETIFKQVIETFENR